MAKNKKSRKAKRKNMIQRINKKGVFYSLSIALILIFIIIIFNNQASLQRKDDLFHLERAQIIVMDNFAKDFDRYYAENILQTAAKPALVELTKLEPFSPIAGTDLINIMTDGNGTGITMNSLLSTNEGFRQSLGTLSFTMGEKTFDYILGSAEQINYTTLRLNFNANYHFKAFNTSTWSRSKLVSITIPVYGLTHPMYHKVIDSSWIENDTTQCFVNQIFADAEACSGINIMPRPVCGNGILEGAEDCDDSNTVSGDGCNEHCNIEAAVPATP